MADLRKPSLIEPDLKADQAEAVAALKQARADHAQRKSEDRRNVLLGQFFAEHVACNPKLRDYVEKHVFSFHTRQRDRDFLRTWLDRIDKKTSRE
ncbi:hypothetical protein [Gellertiella hungarica]|uniref:Uncharacterized protein n=1 Tax=Gellertiella hungarica TaxID=1572859 RepID=A0A7W6NN56_9HYPH|nr:hypothetical protein [Gellertiella hungarica]MBB4067389.1 hypothetical protein [Gellertiella hungarica]